MMLAKKSTGHQNTNVIEIKYFTHPVELWKKSIHVSGNRYFIGSHYVTSKNFEKKNLMKLSIHKHYKIYVNKVNSP